MASDIVQTHPPSPPSAAAVAGVVVRGHGVASGRAGDPRFPGGTIAMQVPFFRTLGLDLAGFHPGTLNVDCAPLRFRPGPGALRFERVKWHPDAPAETFSFARATLVRAGVRFPAWIYWPHPETKPEHFQPGGVVEILAPFVPGLAYGERVALETEPSQALWLPCDGGASSDIVQTGFEVRIRVDLRGVREDEPLVEAGPLRIALRMAGGDPGLAKYDRDGGNYLHFPMPDGSCPVVEATLAGLRVGIPLALLAPAAGPREVVVRSAATHVTIAVDVHEDDDMLAVPSLEADLGAPRTLSPRVTGVEVAVPAEPGAPTPDARPLSRSIQYWTPDGHDAWVGDVAPCFFGGRLHVFYLFDRRHHGSKGGAGGHFFAHLSTADLAHWDEHPPAVPIEAWWETVGTGTPFVHEGRLCLAYGLHTERLSKDPALPAGATWAVSAGGVRFRKTGRVFHPTRNPTVYNRPDGLLGLATGYDGQSGLWTAPAPEGPWTARDATLPTSGDCPCPFEWNGHHYLLQGFGGFAHSATGEPGTWEDWAAAGLAPYDGLAVPMVAPFGRDRRILAGWLGYHAEAWWGGWLVLRELVQFPDGTLGTKWVPEIEPPSPPAVFGLDPGRALRLVFPRRDGGPALVFRLDPATRTASFADDVPEPRFGALHSADNVRIGRLPQLGPGAAVRIVRHYDPKGDATIFDAEIAGVRTLICRRRGRYREGG